MTRSPLTPALVAALLAGTLAACQTGTGAATGAAGGAVTGAVVGGPVGAAVGGIAGAAIGAALTPAETTQVRQYVVTQNRPSVRLAEEVQIGEPLPPRVRTYPIPASVGLQREYGYTIVNDRTVLIDPRTREVVTYLD
jgi:Protein of unknown function (DUF1236)